MTKSRFRFLILCGSPLLGHQPIRLDKMVSNVHAAIYMIIEMEHQLLAMSIDSSPEGLKEAVGIDQHRIPLLNLSAGFRRLIQANFTRLAFIYLLLIAIFACSSAPIVYPPKEAPSTVRFLEYIRLHGNEDKKFAGVELAQDDLISIMASGKIRMNRGGRLLGAYAVRVRIGEDIYGSPFTVTTGATFSAPNSGKLYFEINDSYYQDNSGFFDLTVVVWNTKKYAEIISFLEILKAKTSDQVAFQDAIDQAQFMLDIELAQKATSEKIETAKQELAELQQVDEKKIETTEAIPKLLQVQKLEKRLSELTAKMAELDELSRQLQQARGTTAELTRQLGELERRERDLVGKAVGPTASLPIILISSPEDNERSFADSLRLSGAAEDRNGLTRLEVYLNGSLIPSAEKGASGHTDGGYPKRLTFDRRLALKNGLNRIQVVATGLTGLSVEKHLTAHYTPWSRNVWAVVVGINDYPKLPNLKYAVNDAKAFFDLLAGDNLIPAANITLLVNEQATLRNLRSALGIRLKEAAGKDDMVIIYFAGHGAVEPDTKSPDADGLEKYLLAYDADPSELYATGLPMREIAHILERIRSERLIFIADSCYSGASGGRTVSTGGIRANISDTFLDRIAGGRGKVIITASAANEVSVEKDELQHGVFTYYLLEALKGAADTDGDGAVTVDEAYRYVSEKVPRATGQEQHPVKKGSVEGRLVLTITPAQ
jgi:hypothetical protein